MGLSLLDVGVSCSWGEALLLYASLIEDPTSHLAAAEAGWSYPASVAELAVTLLSQGVLSYLLEKGKSVSFPLPWERRPEQEVVAPEVAEELRERLQQYSAF